ncbi:transporter substrate-binding domain-containing protein [uncultured Roseobacter sp.]|uniref:transporter substrate-binding domain-containing protein n=1 Tax=uncultured Roseobacter sp. TaxID=114847 RepID=UPI0026018E1C|nr:transporter substrate-binding domain-containing protein [uncultured Roseobacter sp.]
MVRPLAIAIFVLSLQATAAQAQVCGGPYIVRPGDSLSLIAARAYRNAFLWTRIFEDNRDVIGPDPDRILVGSRLVLPCDEQGNPVAEVLSPENKTLTDNDPEPEIPAPITATALYEIAPFVTEARPNGGMITDIFSTALQKAFPERAGPVRPGPGTTADAPVVFPLFACDRDARDRICDRFLLADPVFEVLIHLYVRTQDPLILNGSHQPDPARLCRPAGFQQVTPEENRMRRMETAEACFAALIDGRVDGVVLNEFSGRQTLARMGLSDNTVTQEAHPLAITTLHAGVRVASPGAGQVLADLNQALASMRKDGSFQVLLDRHLTYVWAGL